MKTAAIVITFHPDVRALVSNILSFQEDVDYVLVWRNSQENLQELEAIHEKIILCGSGRNEYIAKPLNYALKWCVEHDCDYLMTMDQDSTWQNFSGFIGEVRDLQEDGGVAIYAPNVNHIYSDNEEYVFAESVITSGSVCNVAIANKLGGFREDYQIYWVDGEFCHWLRLNGYKIKVLSRYNMIQQFGKESTTWLGYTTSNYSPIVYYFIFRNMLWMKREYGNNPSWRCVFYTSFYHLRGIILGENHKTQKILMIGKAYWNGLFHPVNKRRQRQE